MKTKICAKCKKRKKVNEFYYDKKIKSHLSSYCKTCIINDVSVWRELNKKKFKKNTKKRYKNNKGFYKIKNKQQYEKNKKSILKKQRLYRLAHKKEINKYFRNRLKNDKLFKLSSLLRNRIGMALKHNYKTGSTEQLLGCSIEFLKKHLEKQFKEGMNWMNQGKGSNGKKEWQIDHIIPCSKFDLTNELEQKKCFNYTNLQPLWAIENWRKRANI